MRKTIALVLSISLIAASALPVICLDGTSGAFCASDNWQALITHLQNVFNGIASLVLGSDIINKPDFTISQPKVNRIFYVDRGNAYGDLLGEPLIWASHVVNAD